MYQKEFVSYDIETIGNDNCVDYWSSAKVSAPSTYKDPDKIKSYIDTKRSKLRTQSALFWWTAQIVCISCIDSDGDAEVFTGDDERHVINSFFKHLDVIEFKKGSNVRLIGKNSKEFDAPMIVGRCLANELPIHESFKNNNLRDVDEMFSYSRSSSQVGKLSDYAWGLKIMGKSSSGGAVEGLWNRIIMGDKSAKTELEKYCLQDSQIVHTMLTRYQQSYKQEQKTDSEDLEIPF